MYIKVNNGVTENYTIGQLRRDNPNTSFPKSITAELLSEYSVYPVVEITRPSIDNRTQHLSRNEQATQINGAWVYEWIVTDKTEEEISQYDAQQAEDVRSKRDAKLAETDWMVIKSAETGVALSTEMTAYRQALRDITTHANFPYLQDSDWPETV